MEGLRVVDSETGEELEAVARVVKLSQSMRNFTYALYRGTVSADDGVAATFCRMLLDAQAGALLAYTVKLDDAQGYILRYVDKREVPALVHELGEFLAYERVTKRAKPKAVRGQVVAPAGVTLLDDARAKRAAEGAKS